MTDSPDNPETEPTTEDTADVSALVKTIESAIEDHQQSQEQLRQTMAALQASIEEHQKSEQKLREILTHADYLIDQFETELSRDYQTHTRSQDRTETDTQQETDTTAEPASEPEQNDTTAGDEGKGEALLTALERLSADLDRVPEAADIKQETSYTPAQYGEEFGSLMEACKQSDLDLEHYVTRDIAGFAEERGTIPAVSEYQTEGRFSQSLINSLFGSWKEVKKQLYRYQSLSGFSSTTDSYREELIYQLRQLEQTLGHLPAASQINEETWVNNQDYRAEFGSLESAFDACGFDVEKRILQDINRVQADIGSVPSLSEYKEYGRCSVNIVTNHFGSWAAAKETYIDQQDEFNDPPKSEADESASNAATAPEGDGESDILDSIVNDFGDGSARPAPSDSTDSGEEPNSDPETAQDRTDGIDEDRISEKYEDRIVEAVNANFDSPDASMSPELKARRQNAAAALETALNATEAIGRTEIIDEFYDDELYSSRGSFWINNIRPVLREIDTYRRGEGGYMFSDQNPD
jgi:hypothetical protein